MNREKLEAWLKEHGLKIDEVLIIDPENSISSDNNATTPTVSDENLSLSDVSESTGRGFVLGTPGGGKGFLIDMFD